MKRTTKKVLSLLISAAMVFSLSTAAFAEQATPETIARAETAVEQIQAAKAAVTALEEQSPEIAVQNDAADTVAMFRTGFYENGQKIFSVEESCASLQEAFNRAREYTEANAEAMWSDGRTILLEICLEKDCQECVQVQAMKIPVSFYLNDHTLTARGPCAFLLANGAGMTVMDGGSAGTGKIVGGNSPIFFNGGFDQSVYLNVYGGTFDSTEAFMKDVGSVQEPHVTVTAGRFLHAGPDTSMIAKGYELVDRGGVWNVQEKTDGVATVTGTIDGEWKTVGCATLQKAFTMAASMPDYAQIKLTQNVTESITLDNVSGHTVQLDLNGYIITAANDGPALHLGSNFDNGNLMIVDNFNGQGGVRGGQQVAVQIDKTEQIMPTLYIAAGVYTSDAAPVVVNSGKSQLMGGTFTGAANQPVVEDHSVKYTTTNNGYVYLGGAVFRANDTGYLFRNTVDDAGSYGSLWINSTSDQYGNETLGQFYGNVGDEASLYNVLYVKTGKFDRELNSRFVHTASIQAQEEGMYVVRYGGPVATAGGTTYDGVQDAVHMQGQNGEIVKLLRDTSENVFINPDTNVTINLDGKTLTQKSGGQLNAVINNNGTLTIRGGGALAGTLAMHNENAVTYLESRDQLQGNLADGVAFMKDKVDDMYAIMTYSVKTATQLNNAIGTADKAVKSFYGSTQQLSALTADQMKKANNMAAEEKQLIKDAYNALPKDQTAVQRVLATENYAPLEASRQIVLDLYNACRNHEIDTENKDVVSEVDASKAEVPTTDAEVPVDKRPTAEDAKKAVEKIVAEVTANTAVNDFKDNGLTQVVDLTTLSPEAASAGRLVFSVQVSLQKVELDAQVIKDSNGTVTEIKLPGKTLVFNVEPMVSVDGGTAAKLENDQLNGGSVVFRLPIPAEVTEKYAKVAHEGDADRYIEIKTEDGKKYIELSATHFSVFTVSFTNELPKPVEPEKPAASVQDNGSTNTASNSQSTTTTPKQDDSAYYTCKACGYHDWTAVDGGYKCNHCGYIESVKQLAGYPNVKGTATVGKAAANDKTTKAAMSAIPQTSDDMPVTALAIAAIAALLGLGVTVVLKRKNQ